MCSGNITRYNCGHEDRAYYYICPDGANEHYQELLPHRLVGRRFRTTRLCRDCEEQRRDAELFENDNRETDEERAKALMEYFRGERPWPRPDNEVSETFARAYATGERLHPWLNRGNEPVLEQYRTLIREYFANEIDPEFKDTGTHLFQIMLDRQADIDRTGRPIMADDREFSLIRLIEWGAQFAAEVRAREQARHDELREREQALRNREQTLRDREENLRQGIREIYQANEEGLQAIARLRGQIRVEQQALDQRRGFVNETLQNARQDEVSENFAFAYTVGQRLHPWRGGEPALDRFRILIREAFTNEIDPNDTGETGTVLFQEMLNRQADIDQTGRLMTYDNRRFFLNNIVELGLQFPREARDQVRWAGEIAEAVAEREQESPQEGEDVRSQIREPFDRLQEQIREREQELDQLRGEIADQHIEEARELEPVIQQQEEPQVERPAGLYESDPEWLLNFDDWCIENSDGDFPYTETDLRRDLNGWFQHLRTCQSQARLDWIPFAETFRDAIQAGDRCHYEYVPIPNSLGWEPLSFRNWCIENADPAEIRVSPMNYTFISLLQRFADYLRSNGYSGDLAAFLHERSVRVKIMRGQLALIPGAPISRHSSDTEMAEDIPSNRQMLVDIGRLSREGGHTAEADILQRQAQMSRFCRLRNEANAVHGGYLAEFRIEREEREARAREEIEDEVETDIDDDDLFMVPPARRIQSIRGRSAREERDRGRRAARGE